MTTAVVRTGLIAVAGFLVRESIGAPRRDIEATVARSPRFTRGAFHNRLPGTVVVAPPDERPEGMLRAILNRKRVGSPARPVPVVTAPAPAAAAALAATWYGHASVLVEVDGRRVLTDPVWSERISPSRLIGPRRMHPVPVPLAQLPPLDVVLISHDHFDHLDMWTVRALLRGSSAPFVVPLGVGAHLRRWGAPHDRIVELDWDETAVVAGLTFTCTEARHFSGRWLDVRNSTLWSSWAIHGPRHRVFFGGDTGFTPAFGGIGDRLGPFDLTLLPIGAYNERWPDIHLNPEEAVRVHRDLGGGLLLPVHWATFNLAFHPWAEPAQRLAAAAEEAGVAIAVPHPGERFDATAPPPLRDWWTPCAGPNAT